MWAVSDLWRILVAGGSVTPAVEVASSLAGTRLADLDPVSWRVSSSSDGRKVSSDLSLSVADPNGDLTLGLRAPLGFVGQRLTVRAGFEAPYGAPELVPMGTWVIHNPGGVAPEWADYGTMQVRRGGVVQPQASDLLAMIEGDDFTALTGPLAGGTVRSEVLRIVGSRLPIAGAWPGVNDLVPVPGGTYSDNRLTALCDVLELAGAVAWVNRAGALQPIPAVKGTIDRVVSGAVKARRVEGGREGLYNRVIVTGTDDAGAPLIGIASETTGPLAVDGPYGVMAKRVGNPLGKTQAALDATAQTYLEQGIAARTVRLVVELVTPDFALDVLDRVTVRDPDGDLTGMVQSATHTHTSTELTVAVPWSEVWR